MADSVLLQNGEEKISELDQEYSKQQTDAEQESDRSEDSETKSPRKNKKEKPEPDQSFIELRDIFAQENVNQEDVEMYVGQIFNNIQRTNVSELFGKTGSNDIITTDKFNAIIASGKKSVFAEYDSFFDEEENVWVNFRGDKLPGKLYENDTLRNAQLKSKALKFKFTDKFGNEEKKNNENLHQLIGEQIYYFAHCADKKTLRFIGIFTLQEGDSVLIEIPGTKYEMEASYYCLA